MNFRSLTTALSTVLLTAILPSQLLAQDILISDDGSTDNNAVWADVDSAGMSHIVWSCSDDLCYKMTDSSQNTLIDTTVLSNIVSRQPRLVIGTDDRAYIVAHEEGVGLTFFIIDPSLDDQSGDDATPGTIIEVEELIGDGSVIDDPVHGKLALDDDNHAHIVYDDYYNDHPLAYTQLDSAGIVLISETEFGYSDSYHPTTSIAVDSNGDVHLSWTDEGSTDNDELYYAMLSGDTGDFLIAETLMTADDDYRDKHTNIFAHDGLVSIVWGKQTADTVVQEVYFMQLDPALDDQSGDAAVAGNIITIAEKRLTDDDGEISWYISAQQNDNGNIDITTSGGDNNYGDPVRYLQISSDGCTSSEQIVSTRDTDYDAYINYSVVAGGGIFMQQDDDIADLQIYRVDAPTVAVAACGGGVDADYFDDSRVDFNGSSSGCTMNPNGRPDPTFPLLIVASLMYLTRRKWMRVQ
jgi:hypothetical protein